MYHKNIVIISRTVITFYHDLNESQSMIKYFETGPAENAEYLSSILDRNHEFQGQILFNKMMCGIKLFNCFYNAYPENPYSTLKHISK